ncbi:hypothetical protein VTN02DRAFT_201 [Thermoascus thermophilus]
MRYEDAAGQPASRTSMMLRACGGWRPNRGTAGGSASDGQDWPRPSPTSGLTQRRKACCEVDELVYPRRCELRGSRSVRRDASTGRGRSRRGADIYPSFASQVRPAPPDATSREHAWTSATLCRDRDEDDASGYLGTRPDSVLPVAETWWSAMVNNNSNAAPDAEETR